MVSVQFGTVARDVGRILRVVALMPLASILVAVVVGEFYAVPAFVATAVVFAAVGTGLARRYADAPQPGKLHGMMIAAAAWAFVALLGSLPFLLVAGTIAYGPSWLATPELGETTAAFLRPLHAVFESMSGYTSTGLTMATDESTLPSSIQWWRSFTEWVGGVGVIVLTVGILARPGSGSLTLYESEARSEKIHPSIVSTARDIWKLYLGFTVGAIALFFLAGMPVWDAINHAMTAISTGGFSVHADSIGHYGEPLIEYAVIPVMVAGSIAFPVHYLIFKGEIRNLYADLQTRWVFIWFTVGSAVLIAILSLRGFYGSLEETIRIGLFQFVSATSNAGFGTATLGGGTEQVWTADAILFLCLGMLTGAAAGSTVGGLKLIRVITLVKGVRWRISGVFTPVSAVRRLQLGDRRLSADQAAKEIEEAAIVLVLWFAFLAIGIAVMLAILPTETPTEYVIFDVMSAQSTVGLDTGITGVEMPNAGKAVLIINMWVGRLEIIPVVVLLRGALLRFDLYR
ncbi:TrkH family potassium uptake protein [Halopiger goleimassiliensis]|uniref:TrkH family potassium uptake protein n=1 Tax=Halopiger goleimassiliensis TaxID=1293048 RepID=UPI000A778BC6|nr:TrkH family potassium uptake protein [Halopiger goleimassiliensis]